MKRSFLMFIAAAAIAGAGSLVAQSPAPEIPYDANADLLKFPDNIHLGEAAGVATNSRGHIFVYSRSGAAHATLGTSRTFYKAGAPGAGGGGRGAAPEGRGAPGAGAPGAAGAGGAAPAAAQGGGCGPAGPPGSGIPGDSFVRTAGVAWDRAGNIYVADGAGNGIGNARVAKFDKDGHFIKSWGQRGGEPGQFNSLRGIALDAQGNVYVADAGNKRIQVFDGDGNAKAQIANIGIPAAICITPGAHQYLYSSNSNDTETLDNGEIYKLELDGKIVGRFGRAGKLPKEFGIVK